MKDWVKRSLDEIDSLFPVDRIKRSKERWTRVWNGERPLDRYPFHTGFPLFNPYNINHPAAERLRAYLDACIFMGRMRDDFIPTIFPGCKQSTIPNMFGAGEIIVGIESSCERIISRAEDIDRLPEPSMAPGTVAYEWLSMQEYLLEETEGRIPIHICDMQGPIDVCGQLWGYDNLFVCAYEEPEYFHKLLSKVTDAFILFWKKQQAILGDTFVGTHLFAWDWVPLDNGAALSADSLVMVSPDYYDQFFKPYIERIGKTFGGLAVHSCGDFRAVIPNLCNTPHVKAVNASQLSVEQLINAGIDKEKVIIAFLNVGNHELEKNMALIRDHAINASISILDIWPSGEEKSENPASWMAKDWREIREKEEKVLEIMSIV